MPRSALQGVCFGHQLVGTAYNGKVGRAGFFECGAREVAVHKQACAAVGAPWALELAGLGGVAINECHQDQVRAAAGLLLFGRRGQTGRPLGMRAIDGLRASIVFATDTPAAWCRSWRCPRAPPCWPPPTAAPSRCLRWAAMSWASRCAALKILLPWRGTSLLAGLRLPITLI